MKKQYPCAHTYVCYIQKSFLHENKKKIFAFMKTSAAAHVCQQVFSIQVFSTKSKNFVIYIFSNISWSLNKEN